MTSLSDVRLILFNAPQQQSEWPLGRVTTIQKSVPAVYDFMRNNIESAGEEAWFFWDANLGNPDPHALANLLSSTGEVWHSGLKLGLSGLPRLLDFVHPNWMLNRDPDGDRSATSWRLSLRACLIRVAALRQLGGILPHFETLDAAALEMGHRYLMSGAIVRYVPSFLDPRSAPDPVELPLTDEALFLYNRTDRRWTYWALGRALLSRFAGTRDVLNAYSKIRSIPQPQKPPIYKRTLSEPQAGPPKTVSVLIPTLDRYEYLRKLLGQLQTQTTAPLEIIIIDQTPKQRRITSLSKEFPSLPLEIIYRDEPGQCSSRNEGLAIARGEYVLFLDDDDEIPADLIEKHLVCLQNFHARVSSGVADETGIETLPEHFTYLRCSDVFPTNNSMIRKDVLEDSGLFDPALDRGEMEDFDLGMRIYLAGDLMILNPDIRVLHHHAPKGGLRTHGARVITYAHSRRSLLRRKILSISELYIYKRFLNPHQISESMLLSVAGTLSSHGNVIKKIFRFLIGFLLLPHTIWQTRKNSRLADQLRKDRPWHPLVADRETQPLSSLP